MLNNTRNRFVHMHVREREGTNSLLPIPDHRATDGVGIGRGRGGREPKDRGRGIGVGVGREVYRGRGKGRGKWKGKWRGMEGMSGREEEGGGEGRG